VPFRLNIYLPCVVWNKCLVHFAGHYWMIGMHHRKYLSCINFRSRDQQKHMISEVSSGLNIAIKMLFISRWS